MSAMWDYITSNPTKLFSKVIAVLAVLQVSTVIPSAWQGYITLAIAIIVALLGEGNTQKIADATASRHMDTIANLTAVPPSTGEKQP